MEFRSMIKNVVLEDSEGIIISLFFGFLGKIGK
jgi:hypothetical protein